MSVDVSLSVSGNYRQAVRALHAAAGGGGLRREMTQAIRDEAKPVGAAIKASVPAYMPRGGGYAATFQADLTVLFTPLAGGVRGSASAKGRDVGARQKGRLRHPVYGRARVSHKRKRFIENPWVLQTKGMRPGFFTDPVEKHRDDVAQAVVRAVQKVADRIG